MPKKLSQADFIERANNVHKNKYEYNNVSYVNDNTKVEVDCKMHGVFMVTPTNHVHRKSGCPLCANLRISKKLALGTEEFIKRSKIIHENFYDYSLVSYVNNHTKVKIICPKHGVFEQQPQLHTNQECGCPKCKSSKGERNVRKWLKTNNFNFTEQKYFKDCVYKQQLPFDFFLPKLNILIEYQGFQHYDKRSSFYKRGGIDTFEIVQKRDAIKRKYAKNNGFQLIEIHYNHSIDKILSKVLLPV